MSKGPILEARKKLLNFVGSARDSSPPESQTSEPNAWEVTLGKRRYRLVPVDSTEDSERSPAEFLTPRELQIVTLVADGKVNKQIADILRISEWTVSTHLRRIFVKLGVDTRAAMVSRCFGAISLSKE